MTQRKYSVALVGLKIDGFLGTTLQDGGFRLSYDIQDVESSDGDFETPDVMVKFTGPDVDLLLANRAELLLALEHVTMEMLQDAFRGPFAHFLRCQRLPAAAD